jgi:hypothetical protein
VIAVIALPAAIAALVNELASLPGAVAVVLGGSRADGTHDANGDWDLGLYYRGAIDLTALRAHGTVHPPGSWGRLMNGGAWLTCGGARVDVLLRDLDAVDHWTRRAQDGDFEVDALLGYVAGVPTYLLTAELASCVLLRGELAAAPYPPRLVETGPRRWRFCRTFSLDYARAQAARGNRVGAIGQAAKAVMEEGHAVLCARGQWICNEKRLIDAAGLGAIQRHFDAIPGEPAALLTWIDRLAAALGVPAGSTAPWTTDGRRQD